MKIAVVGSRSIKDEKMVHAFMEECINWQKDDVVVSGGAKGVDHFAETFADKHDLETLIFTAQWDVYGKAAGFIRNEDIIKACDLCICVWDGESHGAKHDIELCKKFKKPICIYNLKTNKKTFPSDEVYALF